MFLHNYLNISNYGSKQFEYKIAFKDEAEFYKDIKDQKKLYWWFGDGINECDIELANIVACFIRPHLPSYTKLILKTIYLKYQRQERPTIDCRASLLDGHIGLFNNYDYIQVPYLHGADLRYFENSKIQLFASEMIETEGQIILPDEGAKILIGQGRYFVSILNEPIVCLKERTPEGIKTIMPKIENEGNEFAIVDDIIAGGDSIINVINLLREQKPKAKITIYCIFLMSQYGYDNIKKKCGDVEIKPIFDLRNKINPSFN